MWEALKDGNSTVTARHLYSRYIFSVPIHKCSRNDTLSKTTSSCILRPHSVTRELCNGLSLLLGRVGFLGCRWNKNFRRPPGGMRYCRKLYRCGIAPLSFPSPCHGRSIAVVSVGLRSEPVSRASPSMSEWCPVQHQAGCLCSSCSPLVRCTQRPHGHVAMEETRQVQGNGSKAEGTREPRARTFVCVGDYVFPSFPRLALAPPLLANDFCSQV